MKLGWPLVLIINHQDHIKLILFSSIRTASWMSQNVKNTLWSTYWAVTATAHCEVKYMTTWICTLFKYTFYIFTKVAHYICVLSHMLCRHISIINKKCMYCNEGLKAWLSVHFKIGWDERFHMRAKSDGSYKPLIEKIILYS